MSTRIRYLTAGESHGQGLMMIIEGIPSGLSIREEDINRELRRRQVGYGRGARMRIEKDKAKILSGVRGGNSLGSPISILIPNLDWKNWEKVMGVNEPPPQNVYTSFTRPRPGHADLTGGMKYDFSDLRNVLERASARETAARVAAGAVCKKLLAEFDGKILSRVIQIGKEKDESTWQAIFDRYDDIEKSPLRCGDPDVERRMVALIDRAKDAGDSLGGVFEVVVEGIPPGLGDYTQWDLKLDARLSFALASIQAIVGVEVGAGFRTASLFGSEVQDEIAYERRRGFYRLSNKLGGIEGGMSTGEPIILRAAMKPISTLARPLRSVDIVSRQEVQASKERSDVCAVPAASIIAEAVVAIEIIRIMREKFGGDSLREMRDNYNSYRRYLGETWG